MEAYKNLYRFLQSHGFKAVDKKDDINWNSYYHLFTDGVCDIRISRPEKFPTIDIRSSSALSVWYDLALIKDYLNDEKTLSRHVTLKEYMDFLEEDIDHIKELFSTANYLKIQQELHWLLKERTRQMMEDEGTEFGD